MALKDRVKDFQCPLFEARSDGTGCVSLLANDACARPEQFFCEDSRALTPLRITRPTPLATAVNELVPASAKTQIVSPVPANDAPPRPPRPNTPTRFVGTDLLGDEVWAVERAVPRQQVVAPNEPKQEAIVNASNEELAPIDAGEMEAHLQDPQIGDVWVVQEHTAEERVELTPASVRLLKMCLDIFPGANVVEIRRKPKS